MNEQGQCEYCRHGRHGPVEVPPDVAAVFVDRIVPRAGLCKEIVTNGFSCNCDGRTQWLTVVVANREEAARVAERIADAGYELYRFNSGDIAVRCVDGNDDLLDGVLLAAFSSTLPPVASYDEFRQRVGI